MENSTETTSNIHLDFEQAKAKHLLFKSKLRSILYGAELIDESPVVSHYECAVGKWIYNHALKAYGHIPDMQELEKVHADIHTSARKLIALYKDGKAEEARKGLTGMEKIADHLIALLAIVEHKLSIEPPKTNTQYEGLETTRAELNDLLKANEHLDKRIQEQSGQLINERQVLYSSLMNTPAGIAILKGDTHIYEFANSNYDKLVGRKITLGKTVEELFPEIEQQGIIAMLNNVFSTGEPFIANELPLELNTKGDGILEKFFLNLVIQPLRDENGNVERLLAHIIDITEQVTARKKIEASEKRFSNILSQSLMAIAIFKGPEMVVTFANEPMLSVLGKGNAVLNKPLTEGVPELKDQVFPKLLADVYTTGVPFEAFETKAILVRNGIPVDAYFNFVYQPYRDIDDTITGITVLATEVTEHVNAKRKIAESETQFRNIANSIPQLAWIANADGWIYWYNQRWYDYTGTTLEEMEGWGWEKVHHPDHIERVINFVKDAWHKDVPFELTFPLKSNDGVYRWFLTRAYPVKNLEGKVIQWIGTNTDIDDQKKSLEQKDEFMSIASHELKTPVTSLKGFTQILQMKFEKEGNTEAVGLLSKMDNQVNKLTKLIVDLLDATKIENGQIQFSKEDFDFNIVVLETVEEMQRTTTSHKIIVELAENKIINADKNRIGQVITNLISNAIKYSPDNNFIKVTGSNEENKIKLCVLDYGIGIAKEKQSQIFDRFFRVSGENKYTFPGLGLGLFISSEIIKRHNGNILIDSEENKGSTFCFTLPLK